MRRAGGICATAVPHLAVERIEFGQIGLRIGAKDRGIGGVGGHQRVADIGDIDLRVGDRLPGMRIGGGADAARRDAVGRGDDLGLAAGGLHQPRQPALEAKAVDDEKPGIRDLLRIRRRRRIDVHVAIGTDQGRDIDAIAADIFDEIAEDRKAGDDVRGDPARAPGSSRHEQQADQPKLQTPHRFAATLRDGGRETSAGPGR